MSVEVIVPWAGSCPFRRRALDWVVGRYRWPVVIAEGPTPWVKARAVAPAVAASTADVVVIADADVWAPGIDEAVVAVETGAPWAVPHRGVFRLSPDGTDNLLDGECWEDQSLDQRPYLGVEGGGIVVAPRETLLDVPLDPRFVEWGQEDESWGIALHHLAGLRYRAKQPLIHLWHPHPPRMDRRHGSIQSRALFRRYLNARRDPAQMRSLIEEAKHVVDQPAEPADHDHPSRPVGL